MSKHIIILLTSYGCPGGPSIKSALDKIKNFSVITADMCPDVYGIDELLPDANDIGYIDSINNIVNIYNVNVVIPCSSAETYRLSEDKDKVKAKVVVNHPKTFENCMDKLMSFRSLPEYAPKYRYVDTEKDFIQACKELNYPDFPLFIKPRISDGSRGAMYIRGSIDYYKAISNKGYMTTRNGFIESLRYSKFPKLLVMEYLPGKEYSIDVLCRYGKTYVAIPRERLKTVGGIAVDTKVEKNDVLIGFAEDIVERFNLSYAINIQFKEDVDGNYKLLEINPRVAGSMCASVGAGVNMFEYIVKLRLGEDIPKTFNVNWNTRMRRVWEEIYTY